MGTVIILQHLLDIRVRVSEASVTEFTRRDLADLEAWSTDGRRAAVCASESDKFAMLYKADHVWASWGVIRESQGILLWNCVTLRDMDVFPTMIDALAAIGGGQIRLQNVFHIAAVDGARSTPLRQVRVR